MSTSNRKSEIANRKSEISNLRFPAPPPNARDHDPNPKLGKSGSDPLYSMSKSPIFIGKKQTENWGLTRFFEPTVNPGLTRFIEGART